MDNTIKKLPKAMASYTRVQIPKTVPGLSLPTKDLEDLDYYELVDLCRYFYKYDPIAGTVINRMAAMSVTNLRNRWDKHTDTEKIFWDKVAAELKKFFKTVSVEYFVHGMVIPEFALTPVMGKKFDPVLGRKRLYFPTELWARDVKNIVVKKRPASARRAIFIEIPQKDIDFVTNQGVYPDGTEDKEGYQELLENFPEYVEALRSGERFFPLPDVNPIMRGITSYDEYPSPFLRNALKALQHKEYLKKMDRTIASRAIDSIRHIKIGDKDFPADDDDITSARSTLETAAQQNELVFNLYTNHTWQIDWVLPPLDVLVNDAKYSEPNADIFLAMGFPRVLTVGETAKSNSSDSKIALLGPISTLSELRDALLAWAEWLYAIIGEVNNMRPPQPFLTPIPLNDITSLIQFSISARQEKAISRDTIAQLYGSTFEDEVLKMRDEEEKLSEFGLDAVTETKNMTDATNPPDQNNPQERKPEPGKPAT